MSDKTTTTYHPNRGDVFYDKTGAIKVMAVADNWAMIRRKGCVPFCVFVNDLMVKYTLHRQEPSE